MCNPTANGPPVALELDAMTRMDLKKELKQLYQPSAKAVTEVNVPAMTYVMIDGEGDPNTSKEYATAVEVLFAVSYAIKFMVKKGPSATDYSVMPLEGLWWADDMTDFAKNKSKRKWTAMIMQPCKPIDSAIAEVKETRCCVCGLAYSRKATVPKLCILGRSPLRARQLKRSISSSRQKEGGSGT
jgi:hypothetical protein